MNDFQYFFGVKMKHFLCVMIILTIVSYPQKTRHYTNIPNDAKTIAVISPNGGELWKAGSQHPIQWTAAEVDSIKIEITTNSGQDWIPVTSAVSASDGSFTWTIPHTISPLCKIRISDAVNSSLMDTSNFDFRIVGNEFLLCSEQTDQLNPKASTDGCGGVIVVWEDFRSADTNIYAQRMDIRGNILWTPGGVPVCTASRIQKSPRIIPDGNGGAIIAWIDRRDGRDDLYAQRINAQGEAQWQSSGILIASAKVSDNLFVSDMTTDEKGGAIFAWCDSATGNRNIYAQRINKYGEKKWSLTKLPVCVEQKDQAFPVVSSDGEGGAFFAWADFKESTTGLYSGAIYSQRIDSSGEAKWTTNGLKLGDKCNYPVITGSGRGSVIIGWWNDSALSAQRIDKNGNISWNAGGVVLTSGRQLTMPGVVNDPQGGALFSWRSEGKVYSQKIDSSGMPAWKQDGLLVGNTVVPPLAAGDGMGGEFIIWLEFKNNHTQYRVQHVLPSGTFELDDNLSTITFSSAGLASIAGNEYGGAFITWADGRNMMGINMDIYALPIGTFFKTEWTPLPTVSTPVSLSTGDQLYPQIAADDNNGGIIVWQDMRNGNSDIYAQHISRNGTVQWPVDGMPVCAAADSQYLPHIISDGNEGTIISWIDRRNGAPEIYVQRISKPGNPIWTTNGVLTASNAADGNIASQRTIIGDNAGGAVITWQDITEAKRGIYAQRIDSSGVLRWASDGAPLCSGIVNPSLPSVCSDGKGGAIITWCDIRLNDTSQVFAQRIDAGGSVRWKVNGVLISNPTNLNTFPSITSDLAGGAIISWWHYTAADKIEIYAQRIDSTGTPQWTSGGIPVCATATNGSQLFSYPVSDGNGGTIVLWWDTRNNFNDFYAQHLGSSGQRLWDATGIPVCSLIPGATLPAITADGNAGAIITWSDVRNGDRDIFAQQVSANSSIAWTANGVAVCTAVDVQQIPSVIATSDGSGIITWQDYRNNNWDIFAQIIRPDGTLRTNHLAETTKQFTLFQNYPNPFNPTTCISYSLENREQVRLRIFDILGKEVATLVNEEKPAGAYEVRFDAANLSSGIYFYTLQTSKAVETKKFVLLK